MTTSETKEPVVSAIGAYFVGNRFHISLSDGREVSVPIDKIPWLDWLAKAPKEDQTNWTLEPNGFAIHWDDLDNGLEISHLLGSKPLI
jgi:hypothetical protein